MIANKYFIILLFYNISLIFILIQIINKNKIQNNKTK